MAVSGINNMSTSFEQLSSMKQINKAADNAAGLSIVEKMNSQVNGYDTGTDNAAAGKDLLNVADGALGTIADSLQRIRELSIQAGNVTYTDDDKAALQDEVGALLKDIQATAKNTEFNTMKLLDGSMADLDLATNPSGGGHKIQLVNATLENLGIEDYDVTGDFDLSVIDEAISKITEARSSIGATTNALGNTISYNMYASQNLSAASSRIEDLDVGEAVSELKKNQVLEQYRLFAQQAKMKEEENKLGILNM